MKSENIQVQAVAGSALAGQGERVLDCRPNERCSLESSKSSMEHHHRRRRRGGGYKIIMLLSQ